jgi:hypothetical protein
MLEKYLGKKEKALTEAAAFWVEGCFSPAAKTPLPQARRAFILESGRGSVRFYKRRTEGCE